MDNWKNIYFEPGYEIDEFGRIRNTKTGLILKSWNLKNGYKQVQIRKNVYSIHRLVAKVFMPLSEFVGGYVLHLDGNKSNNHYLNLKWGTQSENIKLDYEKGIRSKKGENHHLTKFKNNDIDDIRKRIKSGESCASIARHYNVCRQSISNIKNKTSWT